MQMLHKTDKTAHFCAKKKRCCMKTTPLLHYLRSNLLVYIAVAEPQEI